MAKSEKTTRWLIARRARLAAEALEIVQRDNQALEESPVVVVKAHGRKFKGVVMNEQLYSTELDLRRKRQIDYEIKQLNDLLHPAKGAPKKAIDQRRQAAIDEWIHAKAPKPTLGQLAIKHSGLTDRKEQKKWADNLKKTMKRLGLSNRKKGK